MARNVYYRPAGIFYNIMLSVTVTGQMNGLIESGAESAFCTKSDYIRTLLERGLQSLDEKQLRTRDLLAPVKSSAGIKPHRKQRGDAGFMLAPLLYMLALGGIGASVMFSGYSQVLRSNAEMTSVNVVRQQLSSAAQTLSASATLTSGNTILTVPSVYAFGSVTDTARLPSGYSSVTTAVVPAPTAGVVDPAVGIRQLDPWGKYYVYCKWDSAINVGTNPSLSVISAGPDGVLQSNCGHSAAQGDDRINKLSVAEAISRANVWQVASGTGTASFGASSAVQVTPAGALTATSVATTDAITSGTTVTATGALSGASLTLGAALSIGNGGTGSTSAVGARTNLGSTATGDALFTSASAAAARMTLGSTVTGASLFTAADAAAGRTTLGATATGTSLFTAADATAGRTALGATATGASLFTAADAAAARTALGTTTTGAALLTAANASAARTTLALGTMATQDANNVAITGGTMSGVTITGGSFSGTFSGSVAAAGASGQVQFNAAGALGADNGLSWDNTNKRLGIGTAAPIARFQVATPGGGSLYTSDYGCGSYGGIGGNGTLTGCVNYALLTNGTDTYINRPTGNLIQFRENNATQMTIAAGGNVGIGTTTPTTKLNIVTSTNLDGVLLSDGNRWMRMISGTTGAGAWNNITQANDNGILFSGGTPSTGGFVIAPWAAATSGLRIDGNGNVGIATSSPTQLLDVNGNALIRGSVTMIGQQWINNGSPTIYMQDTDHRSAMIHVNSNRFYVLRGQGVNSGNWESTGGYWPLEINLDDNTTNFGSTVHAHGEGAGVNGLVGYSSGAGSGVVGTTTGTGYGVYAYAGGYNAGLARADGYSMVGTGQIYNNGIIRSVAGGFQFPDGTIQTTAASGGGATFCHPQNVSWGASCSNTTSASQSVGGRVTVNYVGGSGCGYWYDGSATVECQSNGTFTVMGGASCTYRNHGGRCSCFTAETLIEMADGTHLPIHKVKKGDRVMGRNRRVNTVLDTDRTLLWKGKNQYLISLNGDKAFMTDNHPVLTTTGWKALSPHIAEREAFDTLKNKVGKLAVGDKIVMSAAKTMRIDSIDIAPQFEENKRLYNLHLDGDYTYLANGMVVYGVIPDKAGNYTLDRQHSGEPSKH